MKIILRLLALTVVAGAGCEHSYRVYDAYHTDYHTWNSGEVVYYHRWAGETHRDANRDFRKIPSNEQREYWDWRHNQH